jgi:hypothetical protein
MANMGTVTFTATVDPSHVMTVLRTVELLRDLLILHGHNWTADEIAAIDAVALACEPKNLHIETTAPDDKRFAGSGI